MKYVIFAAMLVAAACTTGGSTAQGASAQSQSTAASSPSYEDARSNATDAQVRDARRAYRGACEQHNSVGYCECMTGGMAQALSPSELAVATAAFTGASNSAPSETRAHVNAVRATVNSGCMSYR